MDAQFLPKAEYPQPLFGMFLVISSEFRGFHLVWPFSRPFF
jgi:glutamate dehydrogenase